MLALSVFKVSELQNLYFSRIRFLQDLHTRKRKRKFSSPKEKQPIVQHNRVLNFSEMEYNSAISKIYCGENIQNKSF